MAYSRQANSADLGMSFRRSQRMARQGGILNVMPQPPTVAYGAANAVSSLNGNAAHVYTVPLLRNSGTASATPNTTGRVRFSGFPLAASGTTSPDYSYLKANRAYLTGSAFGEPPYILEFDLWGDAFEIGVKGMAGLNLQVFVDDRPIALAPLVPGTLNIPNTGSNYRIKFTFPQGGGHYRIRLEAGIATRIGGIDVAPTHEIIAPTTPGRLPRACIIGDSYSAPAGTGVAAGPSSWAFEFCRVLGWDPIVSAVGGTGYLADGGGVSVTFRARIANDCIALAPDIVVIQGGYNDRPFGQAQVTAEAALLYAQILQELPSVRLYVLGIQHPGVPDATCIAIQSGLESTCARTAPPTPIVDMSTCFARTWPSHDSGDHVHPNESGQRHFGRWAAAGVLATLDP